MFRDKLPYSISIITIEGTTKPFDVKSLFPFEHVNRTDRSSISRHSTLRINSHLIKRNPGKQMQKLRQYADFRFGAFRFS